MTLPLVDDWRQRGLCFGSFHSAFFPQRGGNVRGDVDEARAICAPCPVQAECLDYALTNRLREGIWGGMTYDQRRPGRRRRRVTAGG